MRNFLLPVMLASFSLSSWLDINSIFVQMPHIIQQLPEGWRLPSLISTAIQISNVFPALLSVIRVKIDKNKWNEIPLIYFIFTVKIVSSILLAMFWKRVTFLFGAKRSVCFIVLAFLLSSCATSSRLIFYDYMKRFESSYLFAFFVGESMSSFLPSILAIAQGNKIIIDCKNNSTESVISKPRFSVTLFISMIATFSIMSFGAFISLELIFKPSLLAKFKNTSFNCNRKADRLLKHLNAKSAKKIDDDYFEEEDTAAKPDVTLSIRSCGKTKKCNILLFLSALVTFHLFGIMPSIATYSMLPYGQNAYYIGSVISPLASPAAVLLAHIRPGVSFSTLTIIIGFGVFAVAYTLVTAAFSPCPVFHDTSIGAALILSVTYCGLLLLSYSRVVIASRIRQNQPSMLFWFGTCNQLGSLLGAIPMYLVINTFKLFNARQPCVKYCT